jgi:opacity protein-like surface antigen
MRCFFLVALMLFFNHAIGATERFDASLKIGLDQADVASGGVISAEPVYGLLMGGVLELRISRTFGLQAEMLYVQKGWRESGVVGLDNFETTARLGYIEFPVLMTLSKGTSPRLSIGSGLYWAKRISATATSTLGSVSTTGSIEPIIAGSDFGWLVGMGMQTQCRVSIGGRYSQSISTIDASGLDIEIKNTTWTIMLGYSIF